MNKEVNFETYLYISRNRYKLYVDDKTNFRNLYKRELNIDDKINVDDLDSLSNFLNDNIYKIEKLLGEFIKDITLIIENDQILNIDIGIKKKNYNKSINKSYLKNDLTKVKDLFKESYQDQIIMHMIIMNYDENFKESLYLEVKFISISKNLASLFDKLLEKHQIRVSRHMSGEYIQNFLANHIGEFSLMANKLINGFNKNEVTLVSKNIENKGFFEKFFQLFS